MDKNLKIRLEQALKKHKDDPVVIRNFGEVPAGIQGIAKVVACRISVFEKGEFVGEPYYFASAVVVEPKTFNGMLVEGLRTNVLEPLCDTPRRFRATVEEHTEFVLNELKKLGADVSNVESFEDLQTICEAVASAGIYIRFSTYQSGDFVRHNWLGTIDYNAVKEESDENDEDESPFIDSDENQEDEDEEPTPQRLEKGDGTLVGNGIIKEGMIVKLVKDGFLVEGVVQKSKPRKKTATIILTDGTKVQDVPWDELS